MTKQAVDGVHQFPHEGSQGLPLVFAAGQQALIEGAQAGIEAGGHQRGHEQSPTQIAVATLAEMGPAADRGTGTVVAHVQPGMFDPLANLAIAQQCDFGQQLQGAEFGDAGHGEQQLELGLEGGIVGDQSAGLALQTQQRGIDLPQAALQFPAHTSRGGSRAARDLPTIAGRSAVR